MESTGSQVGYAKKYHAQLLTVTIPGINRSISEASLGHRLRYSNIIYNLIFYKISGGNYEKENYFLNYFVIILIISLSTKIKAQSFDIYVLDKNAGTTKRVTSIANAGEFNASWSNNGKKLHMMW